MKKNHFFILLTAMIILFTGLSDKISAQNKAAGLELNNLDPTVSAGQDFYQYACGGWMKTHPLLDEYARYGTFDKLGEDNQKQIRELIETVSKQNAPAGSIAQKIGDLYKIGMDSAKLERDGITPIAKELEEIKHITNKKQLQEKLAQMHKRGIMPFFMIWAAPDEKNSSINIVNLFQGGLGMPDRDYYLLKDEEDVKKAYQQHVEKMFVFAGYPQKDAKKAAEKVVKIETELAEASFSSIELRDPYKNYNKLTVAELQKLAPAIDWKNYFSAIGVADIQDLVVGQTNFIQTVGKIFHDNSVEDLNIYCTWELINSAASFLTYNMLQQNFEFYGKTLSGIQEMRPRWKRTVDMINGTVGEAVGKLYVEKYFPAESKTRMISLVNNLQDALKARIKKLEWMTEETKEKAIEKLDAFYVKIGYPDKWRSFDALEIKNDSYWENIQRSNVFDFDYMISKVGKPVDKDEWQMNPQTVNAYYNPTTNEICFPAGILQPPFFFPEADDALNYGAIGVVIGHEMTHGFDDQGRRYDKDGNLNDWWTEVDAQQFDVRAQSLAHYFDKIIVLNSNSPVYANGELTLGENIADQGGLVLSYAALQKAQQGKSIEKIDGYTPEQRFYLAYANVWASNIRDKEIMRLTKIDPHSLGRWRVNATLPQIEEFLKAFDIKEGDKMYLPADQKCLVW